MRERIGFDMNTKVYLFPKGRIQEDFEYIFDEIKIEGYIDRIEDFKKLEKSTEKLRSIVILCLPYNEKIDSRAFNINLSKDSDYVWIWDYLTCLDFDIEAAVAGRNIYFCSDDDPDISKELNLEMITNIEAKDLSNLNLDDSFVIVDGYCYDKIPVLELMGWSYGRDFIGLKDLKFRQRLKPSKLLKKVMLTEPVDQPDCEIPFREMQTNVDGRLYGCCPGWTEFEFGNVKQDTPEKVWKSIYAKIFRLSIINRTFCFCKVTNCPRLRKDAKVIDCNERFTHVTEEAPVNIYPALDNTCNLYCASCRKKIEFAQGRDIEEGMYYVDRLINSGWFRENSRLQLSAAGEVFAGVINQRLLYGLPEKCDVWIVSNGCLFTPDKFEKVRNKFNKITVNISVDAASREIYEIVRRGGNWEKLLENLRYLGKQRGNGAIARLYVNFTVQKDNYMDLPEFVKLAKRINVDAAIIKPIYNWGTYSNEKYREIAMFDASAGTVSKELKSILKSDILQDPIVDIKWFKDRL